MEQKAGWGRRVYRGAMVRTPDGRKIQWSVDTGSPWDGSGQVVAPARTVDMVGLAGELLGFGGNNG